MVTSPVSARFANRRRTWLAGLALCFTLLNCLKPLQVDDTAYYFYARHIAWHPLDPYGFDVFWYNHPDPANTILAPPLLLYWWAPAIRVVGEQPFLWKLWLFPFAFLFVTSLDELFRRCARPLQWPLTVMTVLSPTFLPSFNLMLDVPALALALSAIVLFFRASDRQRPLVAFSAGIVAGLAAETKYTGFLAPAVMLLYAFVRALLSRRLGPAIARVALALLAAATAAGAFALCEALLAWSSGESHFLSHFRDTKRAMGEQLSEWTIPLVALLGGVNGAGWLLNLTALRRQPLKVFLAGLAVLLGFALIACLVTDVKVDWWIHPASASAIASGTANWSTEDLVFTLLGAAMLLSLGRVACRLVARNQSRGWWPAPPRRRRLEWFLISWLFLEIAGYFALSPFAAVRRVMGIVVVATLLGGRLAARTCRSPQRLRLVYAVAAFGIALGGFYYAVDFRDAWAWKNAAESAAAYIRTRAPDASIWYVGHWGFQYYAEREGMRAAVADDATRPLHAGDWLVIPDPRLNQQHLMINEKRAQYVTDLAVSDWLPFQTVQGFYGSASGPPLERHTGPRVRVSLYRVTKDFVPTSKPLVLVRLAEPCPPFGSPPS